MLSVSVSESDLLRYISLKDIDLLLSEKVIIQIGVTEKGVPLYKRTGIKPKWRVEVDLLAAETLCPK